MKVLIVEDDPLFAELVRRYLDGLAEIVVAHSWAEAYKYLEPFPTVMWIDLIHQGYGDDVTSSLIRIQGIRKQNSDVVILVVSGALDHDIQDRCLSAGADAFIAKHDIGPQNKAIAHILLALLNAEKRGVDVTKYLEQTQLFLQARLKPLLK